MGELCARFILRDIAAGAKVQAPLSLAQSSVVMKKILAITGPTVAKVTQMETMIMTTLTYLWLEGHGRIRLMLISKRVRICQDEIPPMEFLIGTP